MLHGADGGIGGRQLPLQTVAPVAQQCQLALLVGLSAVGAW